MIAGRWSDASAIRRVYSTALPRWHHGCGLLGNSREKTSACSFLQQLWEVDQAVGGTDNSPPVETLLLLLRHNVILDLVVGAR